MRAGLTAALAALCSLVFAPPAPAAVETALACERAAALASRETGVPIGVLKAIALTETGRRTDGSFRPWPWTVNMEGRGLWFDNAADALDRIEAAIDAGKRSFDVGCFQINYRWHGDAFASVREMFDPMANAIYAARFLSALYAETGDWTLAAGAYHSKTPEFAERYRKLFTRNHDIVSNRPERAAEPPAAPDDIPEIPDIVLAQNAANQVRPVRQNLYPLLMPGSPGLRGSLFSAASGNQRRPLIGPATSADAIAEDARAGEAVQ